MGWIPMSVPEVFVCEALKMPQLMWIPQNTVRSLVHTMRRRGQQCRARNGGYTTYWTANSVHFTFRYLLIVITWGCQSKLLNLIHLFIDYAEAVLNKSVIPLKHSVSSDTSNYPMARVHRAHYALLVKMNNHPTLMLYSYAINCDRVSMATCMQEVEYMMLMCYLHLTFTITT